MLHYMCDGRLSELPENAAGSHIPILKKRKDVAHSCTHGLVAHSSAVIINLVGPVFNPIRRPGYAVPRILLAKFAGQVGFRVWDEEALLRIHVVAGKNLRDSPCLVGTKATDAGSPHFVDPAVVMLPVARAVTNIFESPPIEEMRFFIHLAVVDFVRQVEKPLKAHRTAIIHAHVVLVFEEHPSPNAEVAEEMIV